MTNEADTPQELLPSMKCWQGNLDGKYEGLVVANSQRAAVKIINTSLYDFRRYWHRRPVPTWPEFKPFTLYTKPYDSKDTWKAEAET